MFAAKATSSRALLFRSCRRSCRPLPPRLAHAEPCPTNIKFSAEYRGSNSRSRSHFAFSTVTFDGNDGNAFDANLTSPSSESIDSTSSSSSSFDLGQVPAQIPAQNRHTTQQISGDAHQDSNSQFQQQIQQWTTSNPKIAPYKAEEALSRLWVEQQELFKEWEAEQRHHRTPSPTILLTTESVNSVLQAWCHSNNGEVAAERAERLLHWMENLHSSAESESTPSPWEAYLPKPNYQSYATAIDAWSRAAVYESSHPAGSSSSYSTTERKSGGRAKSHVTSPATKAGFECSKRAEDLLMHMQKMHEMEERNSNVHAQYKYNSEIQPDTRVFNLVLKAWSKLHGGTKASAIRAMRILDLMQELHHFQSMSAPQWQGITMSKVQPNLGTYKLVLAAWATAAHTVEGPDRAEEILRHLLSMSKAGNTMGAEIMPDAECFHIAMKAHAEAVRRRRKGDDGSAPVERAQKVTALLDWMELLAPRLSKIRPTTDSYRIALSSWVWSHHVDAPKEAESILFRMIHAADLGDPNDASVKKGVDSQSLVIPETRDFNTVINCCSFARKVGVDRSEEDDLRLLERQLEHREIYNVAEGALNALISSPYAQPDSATFAGIIRACVNLLPNTDDRDEKAIELFRLAYRTPLTEAPSAKISSTSSERMKAPPGAGCVDANVLRQLRHALPSTQDYIRVREEFEEFRRHNVDEE